MHTDAQTHTHKFIHASLARHTRESPGTLACDTHASPRGLLPVCVCVCARARVCVCVQDLVTSPARNRTVTLNSVALLLCKSYATNPRRPGPTNSRVRAYMAAGLDAVSVLMTRFCTDTPEMLLMMRPVCLLCDVL